MLRGTVPHRRATLPIQTAVSPEKRYSNASHVLIDLLWGSGNAHRPTGPVSLSLRISSTQMQPQEAHARGRQQERDVRVRARYEDDGSDDEVAVLDGEDEYRMMSLMGKARRPLLQQMVSASGVVIDKLTELALQFAPEDASPSVVRTSVAGAMVLVVLSFVKGIVSFILTVGTLMLGAYVAVRVFGIEAGTPQRDASKGTAKKSSKRRKKTRNVSEKRNPSLNRRHEVPGKNDTGINGMLNSLLGTALSDDDEGLLEVRLRPPRSKKRRQ